MKSHTRCAQAILPVAALAAFWSVPVLAAVEQPAPATAVSGAASGPAPLDAYGELPRLEDAAISPDGHNIASVSQVEGDRRVAVIDEKGLYRCAVSVAGIGDIRMMYDTDLQESGDSQMLRKNLRVQLGDPSVYDAISPRRFAAKADAPVLLIHGKDDTVVAYRQSAAMADALKDAGKPYEMVTLASEDHWLSREETRKRMLAETMRFVQKYNPAD